MIYFYQDEDSHPQVRSIYDDMLANFVLDVAIATHRDYKRSRTVCGTCGTKWVNTSKDSEVFS